MVNFLNAPFVQLICLGLVKMNAKEKKAFVARMKKARAAAKKNGGGKKKNSKRTKLEKRIADLERKFDEKLRHHQDFDPRELDFEGDQIRQERIKLSDELKRELESGANN